MPMAELLVPLTFSVIIGTVVFQSLTAKLVADQLGLTPLLDRLPRHLSGGEQRRAGLARVLLAQPAAAVVDEPDAGLDAPSQVAVLTLLRDRCDAGMACLLITHQRGLARRFADRVLHLDQGVLRAA